MTADGVPLASWWWRVLAVVIDYLITTAIVTVITFPVWRSLYATMVSYFNAVMDAQRSGVAPPTLNATDLISGSKPADLDLGDARCRDAVPRGLSALEVGDTWETALWATRCSGRPRP